MASIGIASLLATGGGRSSSRHRDQLTYSTFTPAIGFPMAVILPIIAILSVTGEWSQRSGLTTFTLVPHRGRVIPAKAHRRRRRSASSRCSVAFAVGALGNLVGTRHRRHRPGLGPGR